MLTYIQVEVLVLLHFHTFFLIVEIKKVIYLMEGFDERNFFCSISIESLSLKVVKTKNLMKFFSSVYMIAEDF